MSYIHPGPLKVTIIVIGTVLLLCTASIASASSGAPNSGATVTIEDFSDIVTPLDGGFNDFSGNMGAINAEYLAQMAPVCEANGTDCRLRFGWNFWAANEAFTGLFLSVFGLSDAVVTFDGVLTQTVAFPEHALDLDNVDGAFRSPVDVPHAYEAACATLTNHSTGPITLR